MLSEEGRSPKSCELSDRVLYTAEAAAQTAMVANWEVNSWSRFEPWLDSFEVSIASTSKMVSQLNDSALE